MTKIRPLYFIVGSEGTDSTNDEAEAIRRFRERPDAIRVVRDTEALTRHSFSNEALAFAGIPKARWSNSGSTEPPVVIVERVGGKERWPNE